MSNWFCINLDERTDRLKDIVIQMEELNYDFERFSAIKHTNGAVGCMKSHIRCLELAAEKKLPYVVIMEDDCEFLIDKSKIDFYINEFLKSESPCFVFGGTFSKLEDFNEIFSRARYIKTCTCYIVKNHYFNKLLDIWNKNVILLEKTGHHWNYACDVVWTKLQEKDLWLTPNNIKAIQQKPSYSNIENKNVNYCKLFDR